MTSNRKPMKALILAFVFPFLLVEGFWGYLTWAHAIDDAGRDGRTLDAFDSEATMRALKAFVLDGLGWGAGGLALCYFGLKLSRRKNTSGSN